MVLSCSGVAKMIGAAAIFSFSSSFATEYCATFQSVDGESMGFFRMTLIDGRATYSFDLNLTTFAPITSCDLSNGLYYHIHSNWNNFVEAQNSGLGALDCAATNTGGHYDPALACSASSSSASDLCVLLSRTSTLGYSYNCTSSVYKAGFYAQCEVGDLSGKFGIVMPSASDSFRFSTTGERKIDFNPVFAANYLTADPIAGMWSSVIFHCVDTAKTRLVCAKFVEVSDGTSCAKRAPIASAELGSVTEKEETTSSTEGEADEVTPSSSSSSSSSSSAAAAAVKTGGSKGTIKSSKREAIPRNASPSKSPSSGLHKPTSKPTTSSFKPAEK